MWLIISDDDKTDFKLYGNVSFFSLHFIVVVTRSMLEAAERHLSMA